MLVDDIALEGASLILGSYPPESRWCKSLKAALVQTTLLLEKLSHVSRTIPNPNLLLKPLIPNDLIPKSPEDTLTSVIRIQPRGNMGKLSHILRYNEAIDHSLKLLDQHPWSIELIKKIHAHILMKDEQRQRCRPGEIRDKRVVLRNSATNEIRYTAPPAEDLPELLKRFEIFLQNRKFPPLIHAAICHADFLNIHPFYDGNGRVGYLLTMLLLAESNVIPKNMLNVFVLYSYAYFHATQGAYASVIRSNSPRQRTAWFIYFLDVFSLITDEILHRINAMFHIIYQYQTSFSSSCPKSEIGFRLIEKLSNHPWFTFEHMKDMLNVPSLELQQALTSLESKHILYKFQDNSNGTTIYVAKELMELMDKSLQIVYK